MHFNVTITPLIKHFNDERRWYYTGVGSSIILLIAALSFFSISKIEFLHGIACPSIGFSIVELIICVITLLKSAKDINRVSTIIQNQPERLRIDEFPRMRKVLRNLIIVKILTILTAIAGLWIFFIATSNSFAAGVGLGLFVQGILLYGADHLALKGRLHYWNFLQSTYRFHQINLGFKFPAKHNYQG